MPTKKPDDAPDGESPLAPTTPKTTRTASTTKRSGGLKAAAAAAVKQKVKQEAEEKEKLAQLNLEEFGYTLRCPSCGRDGVYCRANPMETGMGDGEWFSAYKDLDASWPKEAGIYCQFCDSKLRIDDYGNGQKFPYERFVRRYPRAHFENMLKGGEYIPSGKSLKQINNEERRAAKAKAKG